MHYKDYSKQDLILKIRKTNFEKFEKKIKTAIELAEKIHENQKRKSGKPYLTHLINTGYLLTEQNLDIESIIAGILHDSLDYTKEFEPEIKEKFGEEVLEIIKGVNKINFIEAKNIGKISGTILGKVILGSAKDIRGIFVTLFARLDNLRNIEYFDAQTRKNRIKSTMETFVPIAHKLGLYNLEWELKDLSFKYQNPKEYQKLKKLVNETREQRMIKVYNAVKKIKKLLEKEKSNAFVSGRAKSFYGINQKMKRKKLTFNEMNDLLGVRILCENTAECYRTLGLINTHFKPAGQYKDYIINPKPNGYKSIHTMNKINNNIFEIQIRTWEMHRYAEDGLAAHWQYKRFEKDIHFDKKLSWAKQLLNWQSKTKKTSDFLKTLKLGFGKREIFVLTPKNQVIALPEEAVALDFAFAVHTQIGKTCLKAIVNGKQVPLDKKLENADVVEIITSKKPKIKRSWISFVKTSKAKSKIRQALGIKPSKQKIINSQKKATILTTDPRAEIAKCCYPVYGEDIIGIKTTKRKIKIHRIDCGNAKNKPKEKLVKVAWSDKKRKYTTKISISAIDRPEMLIDILNKVSQHKGTIIKTEAKSIAETELEVTLSIAIKENKKLIDMISSINQLDGVKKVKRI